jgi:hypothetical protein
MRKRKPKQEGNSLRRDPMLPDDPQQSKRFIDMAREVEADESPERFEKVFDKVARSKTNATHTVSLPRRTEKPVSS